MDVYFFELKIRTKFFPVCKTLFDVLIDLIDDYFGDNTDNLGNLCKL
jgi:hypothetical protein